MEDEDWDVDVSDGKVDDGGVWMVGEVIYLVGLFEIGVGLVKWVLFFSLRMWLECFCDGVVFGMVGFVVVVVV